ncbi:MAG TPA: hypothetical protein P5044_08920 [bacterium]|nr:hypothetical protein [bacterium]
MKKNIILVISLAAFSAMVLWISGLAPHFYSFNVFVLKKIYGLIHGLF